MSGKRRRESDIHMIPDAPVVKYLLHTGRSTRDGTPDQGPSAEMPGAGTRGEAERSEGEEASKKISNGQVFWCASLPLCDYCPKILHICRFYYIYCINFMSVYN